MARRKTKPIRPEHRACSQCGAIGTIVKQVAHVPTASPDVESASPIYCTYCRADAKQQLEKRASIQRIETQRILDIRGETADTRLERWLVTHNDVIRQARHRLEHQWVDVPGVDANAQPPRPKDRRCGICHDVAPDEPFDITNEHQVRLCDVCADMLADQPQRVVWRSSKSLPTVVHLVECPGCGKPMFRNETGAACQSCHKTAIVALIKSGRETPNGQKTLLKLMHANPAGQCFRCSPDSRKPPWTCPPCWHYFNALPESQFPHERQITWRTAERKCALCETSTITDKATKFEPSTGRYEKVHICRTCSRITTQHTGRKGTSIIELDRCLICASYNMPETHQGLCRKCQAIWSSAETALAALWNYLYDVLETPPEEPMPQPASLVSKWLRPDSTTLRADASQKGRLTETLARHVCIEYVHQMREIPEVAIRFGVSAAAIKSTLTGKSWATSTEGMRPAELLCEPKRVKLAKAQPAKPAMITITRTKGEYGWTDTLVQKHLGEHDREAPNPHYRSAAPMRLYLLDRVHDTMARKPALRAQLQKNLLRRAAAHSEREQRDLEIRKRLLAETARLAETIEVFPPTRDVEGLMSMATKKRSECLDAVLLYDDYDKPQNDGSPEARHRTVNMIRHEYTNYEQLLEIMPRARNAETNTLIYLAIKAKVMDAIAQAIPDLAAASQQRNSEHSLAVGV